MEENYKDEMIVIDNVNRYNEIFGLETKHPLVSIIDLTKATTWPTRAWFRYEVYALFLKNVKCGDIKYGRQYYDYQDGTIVCFGPGQITDLELIQNIQPNAHGLLFHPDLIRGTSLGQEIKNYSFFSYETNEALHLSEEERQIVMDCLQKTMLSTDTVAASSVPISDCCLITVCAFTNGSLKPETKLTMILSSASNICSMNILKEMLRNI